MVNTDCDVAAPVSAVSFIRVDIFSFLIIVVGSADIDNDVFSGYDVVLLSIEFEVFK